MTSITPTVTRVRGENGLDGWQVVWNALTTANNVGVAVGSPIGDSAGSGVSGLGQLAGFADKSIAFTGNFGGAAATIVLEGSNDGTNWFTLTDPQGNLISFAAAQTSMKAITEAVIMWRPHITGGGDGATSLTATMFVRKTQTP